MKHSKKYSSVIMQRTFCVKMHTVKQMIKTANKHWFFIFKLMDIKTRKNMISIPKRSNLKIFCWSFYRIQNIRNKIRVRKNKINIKYSHHLFFCPKIKKKFHIVSLFLKKSPQSRESTRFNLIFFFWIEKSLIDLEIFFNIFFYLNKFKFFQHIFLF